MSTIGVSKGDTRDFDCGPYVAASRLGLSHSDIVDVDSRQLLRA